MTVMTPSLQNLPRQPMIAKYVQHSRIGIQSQNFSRHAVGYVIRGRKYLYYGDMRYEVNRGELFYLGAGTHYVENIPDGDRPFEQIVFYYTTAQLGRILTNLNMTYGLNVTNDHSCEKCSTTAHVVYPAWNTVRNFFLTINQYVREELFASDETAENIKMTELIYLLMTHPDCCLKSKVLGNMDSLRDSFERTVHDHIFSSISIDDLAGKCNRSLTSFKKEFRRHYAEPPHKWFIRQRLMHSRLLLVSTDKSISEIGVACNFPNTSHFIKLFKKEYGSTPANYRSRSSQGRTAMAPKVIPADVNLVALA